MSKSNAFENALMLLLYNNTNIANIGDATGLRGSSSAGSLYVALHTGDPGEGGDQTTSEATYTSYARVAVVRSGSGWTVTANAVANAAEIAFPACTGGTNTVTWASVGVATSGASMILYRHQLTASLAVSAGITPKFAVGELDSSED